MMNIKSSINIKYDLGNRELLRNYYGTTTHSKVINSILKGVVNENHFRSHIIYGPYGTGKSYFSTLLTDILTGSFSNDRDIEFIKNKFRNIDEDAVYSIDKVLNHNKNYIPVILNGNEGNFETALLDNIKIALKNQKIRINLPGIENQILETIKMWKKKYPSTFDAFSDNLKENNIEVNNFINSIKNNDKESLELFINLYTDLTAGSRFTYIPNESIIDIIKMTCEELEKRNYGMFIVYDEFGRFLQNIDDRNISNLMQNMQDLAELANNYLKNLSILFISHKQVSTYFSHLKKEYRAEFSKIEKRFRVFDIKNDYKTFVLVTEKTIKKISTQKLDLKSLQYHVDKVNIYRDVFEEILDYNNLETNISNIYPLHPLTLLLLPKISNIFGQNERTLFTFLTDRSEKGFYKYCIENKGFYYPDGLVDYFFKENDDLLYNELTIFKIYNKQIKEINKLFNGDSKNISRVYKFIMIWNITNQNLSSKITPELISYATDIEVDLICSYLSQLENVKFLKYNPIKNDYEIFQGSSLNLEKEFSKILANNSFNIHDIINILNENNPYAVIYPGKYNALREITRFARVKFIIDDFVDKPCDMNIFITINTEKSYDEDNLYGNLIYDYNDLYEVTSRIYSIDKMLSNYHLLKNNYNLDIELQLEKDFAVNELKKVYKQLFTNGIVYKYGDELDLVFNSKSELENFISNKFEEVYFKDIEIVNNQINMFEITKIQEKAIIHVIQLLLDNKSRVLSIQDNQPYSLVYHSIHNNKSLNNMFEFVREVIIQTGEININEMFKVICGREHGYGVRPKTVLLLLIYSVADLLQDSMIFNGDVFVPNIDGETLFYKTLEENSKYKIIYSHYEHENKEYLEFLERIFPYSSSTTEYKAKTIKICSGMYNWFLSLPIITQQKVNMAPLESKLLSIISYSRSNPQEAITKLIDTFDMEALEVYKNSVDNHFSQFISNLERKLNNSKLVIENQLNEEFIGINKNNKLVRTILENKSLIEAFSTEVDSISIEKWPVAMFDVLINKVQYEIDLLNEKVDFKVLEIDGNKKYIRNSELSTKGKIIEKNIINTIEATSRTISQTELEQILLNLVAKYVK